ncbi:hypothetical protein FRB99_000584 [Tulasnella sp. 403]|nr:hypothetical protein FRB99_000584 [Tulasnella sp. 403]
MVDIRGTRPQLDVSSLSKWHDPKKMRQRGGIFRPTRENPLIGLLLALPKGQDGEGDNDGQANPVDRRWARSPTKQQHRTPGRAKTPKRKSLKATTPRTSTKKRSVSRKQHFEDEDALDDDVGSTERGEPSRAAPISPLKVDLSQYPTTGKSNPIPRRKSFKKLEEIAAQERTSPTRVPALSTDPPYPPSERDGLNRTPKRKRTGRETSRSGSEIPDSRRRSQSRRRQLSPVDEDENFGLDAQPLQSPLAPQNVQQVQPSVAVRPTHKKPRKVPVTAKLSQLAQEDDVGHDGGVGDFESVTQKVPTKRKSIETSGGDIPVEPTDRTAHRPVKRRKTDEGEAQDEAIDKRSLATTKRKAPAKKAAATRDKKKTNDPVEDEEAEKPKRGRPRKKATAGGSAEKDDEVKPRTTKTAVKKKRALPPDEDDNDDDDTSGAVIRQPLMPIRDVTNVIPERILVKEKPEPKPRGRPPNAKKKPAPAPPVAKKNRPPAPRKSMWDRAAAAAEYDDEPDPLDLLS